MNSYIPEEKLMAACEAAAKSLDVTVPVFMRAVFYYKQVEYDRADIKTWLEDNNYKYTEDDVDQILETLRDDWDADRGTWSNIESAYYNNDMKLDTLDGDDGDMEACADCGYDTPNVVAMIIDQNGAICLCPNCYTRRIIEGELSLTGHPSLTDDITGEAGAVKFISGDEEYDLKPETMIRLMARALKPEEWKALAAQYGSHKFLLHEDFYDEDGNALQPLI